MQNDTRPVADLKPYENNPRNHPEDQIDRLARSIQEFGFTVPILIDGKNRIIAGHGRALAAERAGIEDVPVIIADDWSDEQKRAYTILDNQLTESSVWDSSVLISEIERLLESDLDLLELGLDDEFIASLIPQYNPNVSPETGHQNVTAGDMERAQEKGGPARPGGELVDVTCPHCDETFTVMKDAL